MCVHTTVYQFKHLHIIHNWITPIGQRLNPCTKRAQFSGHLSFPTSSSGYESVAPPRAPALTSWRTSTSACAACRAGLPAGPRPTRQSSPLGQQRSARRRLCCPWTRPRRPHSSTRTRSVERDWSTNTACLCSSAHCETHNHALCLGAYQTGL